MLLMEKRSNKLSTSKTKTWKPKERKVMNDKFDELTKGLAQSVTRRHALRHFGIGLACAVLGALGLAKSAEAKPGHRCHCKKPPYYGCDPNDSICYINCSSECTSY